MIPTQRVPDVLLRARDLVTPYFIEAVEGLTDEICAVVKYHLGWLDAEGMPSGSSGGKGVRQALAILSAEATGAEASRAIRGAIAVELVHNFSLIHDDVVDGDATRRHRATVWALYGTGRAIIAGDALLALAQRVILNDTSGSSSSSTERAARSVADATAEMIAGQALDMAFEEMERVEIERCVEMEAGKTGALLSCSSSVGAILADAPREQVEALSRFGLELGLSFQAIDDLLGIWGDPETTGKPAWNDLRQHKKTLPVTAVFSAGGPGADELARILRLEHLKDGEVERAAHLIEECGGRQRANEEAERHLDAALVALDSVELIEGPKDELIEVAHFVVEREF